MPHVVPLQTGNYIQTCHSILHTFANDMESLNNSWSSLKLRISNNTNTCNWKVLL